MPAAVFDPDATAEMAVPGSIRTDALAPPATEGPGEFTFRLCRVPSPVRRRPDPRAPHLPRRLKRPRPAAPRLGDTRLMQTLKPSAPTPKPQPKPAEPMRADAGEFTRMMNADRPVPMATSQFPPLHLWPPAFGSSACRPAARRGGRVHTADECRKAGSHADFAVPCTNGSAGCPRCPGEMPWRYDNSAPAPPAAPSASRPRRVYEDVPDAAACAFQYTGLAPEACRRRGVHADDAQPGCVGRQSL